MSSLDTAMGAEPSVSFIAFFDVILVAVAAPIMLLIGVPALGYCIGAGAWIVLRVVGMGVEHAAEAAKDARAQISIRMGYMLGRLFTLALAVILARGASKNDGPTALAVIVFAFTVQLATSAITRPRRSR